MDSMLFKRAHDFAIAAHAGQKRKYTGEPYVNHCYAVAALLMDYPVGDEVIAAALLHDTLEDTSVTYSQLLAEFGPGVAGLVDEVTDVSRPSDGTRAARKALDRAHLALTSADGATLKLADLIVNARDIVEHDPDFAVVYLAEKADLLKVLKHGNRDIYSLAVRTLAECELKLKSPG